ncbi:MAG TPA: hypothetical protein VF702_10270 [Allosphingosinicella sp.]|jgi:hypothetical protein
MQPVIVSSFEGDAHAGAVLWGLDAIGETAMLWQPHLFPAHAALSIGFEPGEAVRHEAAGRGALPHEPPKTVWLRRSRSPQLADAVDPRDRDFAQGESDQHLDAFLTTAWQDAFWVNPPAAARFDTNKPLQIALARAAGFAVPPTLFTNDPEEVRAFFERHRGNIVYKSYRPERWHDEGGAAPLVNHTAPVSQADLDARDALAMCPGIFQARVPKGFELRVTIMGATSFCARVEAPAAGGGAVDFRSGYASLRIAPFDLDDATAAKCRALMLQAGLVFACFDFIVTPGGELFFLEVNPMGQFLWQEERCPDLPLLDAFCGFLASGDAGFAWRPSASPLRWADYVASMHRHCGHAHHRETAA